MTKRIRFLTYNHFEKAALSAGAGTSFIGSLPIQNLKNSQRSRVARSNTPSSVVIEGTLAEVEAFTACVIWRHNLTAGARWKVELFPDVDQQGDAIDLGWQDALELKAWGDFKWGVGVWGATTFENRPVKFSARWFAPVVARSFRITIEDPNNSYVDITKIYLGQHIEPSSNLSWNHTLGWNYNSDSKRTAGGSISAREKESNRVLDFSLDYLSEEDRPEFLKMAREVGLHKDFFVSVYPEQGGQLEIDYSFAGKFTNISPMARPRKIHFSNSYRIEEQ